MSDQVPQTVPITFVKNYIFLNLPISVVFFRGLIIIPNKRVDS